MVRNDPAGPRQCRKWAIKGGTVCKQHGGALPVVMKSAERRIDRIEADAREALTLQVEKAVARLDGLMDSVDEQVALRAVLAVLDRNGLSVVHKSQAVDEEGDRTLDERIKDLLKGRAERA
jgi:hypothetical protein